MPIQLKIFKDTPDEDIKKLARKLESYCPKDLGLNFELDCIQERRSYFPAICREHLICSFKAERDRSTCETSSAK